MKPTPLKLAIVASGRTQKEIALAAGLSEPHVSRIVNGLRCDDDTKGALATALGLKVDDLWPHDGASNQMPERSGTSSEIAA